MKFEKFILDLPDDIFHQLKPLTQFENVTKGRQGAVLVRKDIHVPIIRTTTIYQSPAQFFKQLHLDIITKIYQKTGLHKALRLNNALIEVYNSEYRKMGFHSDQALDMAKDSYICVYSCYDDPSTKDLRKLIFKEKGSDQEFEVVMEHNSVVIFSSEVNKQHLHKIILDQSTSDAHWLGITFRQSKTNIVYGDEEPPRFEKKYNVIKLATEEQKKEFYKLRGMENSLIDYEYPNLNYTISPSDLVPPQDLVKS